MRVAGWAAAALMAIVGGVIAIRQAIAPGARASISAAPRPAVVPPPEATAAPDEPPRESATSPAPEPAGPAPPASARAATQAQPEETEGLEKPPAPVAPRPLVDGRTYIGAVDLPGGSRIELGGIVWSEEEPRALLNDRVVATDGYIEGFNVARIEENRVMLEKDGLRIYLSLK